MIGTVDIYSMYDWFILIALPSSPLYIHIKKETQTTISPAVDGRAPLLETDLGISEDSILFPVV